MNLAFKIAAKSGSAWSEMIARESNSPYSHVEGWLSGPQNAAQCFSSREPKGAGYATIDLTQPMWEIVPITLTHDQEQLTNGFCLGCNGKMYNGLGLVGFKADIPQMTDPHAIFCSQVWATVARSCWGKQLPVQPWMISPGQLYTLAKEWK